MSTRIAITSGSNALLVTAQRVQGANRQGQQQRSRDNATTAKAELTRSVVTSATERPRGGTPDVSVASRPAAMRRADWALWSVNWVPPYLVGDTGLVDSFGRSYLYLYAGAKALRFGFNTQNSSANAAGGPPVVLYDEAQTGFVVQPAGGPAGVSSNHGNLPLISTDGLFAGVPTDGNQWLAKPPVIASNNRVVFGCQRYSYRRLNTPWEIVGGINPTVSPNGVSFVFVYIFFRYQIGATKPDVKVVDSTVTVPSNAGELVVFDQTPYVEGGSQWASIYAANAFPDDPSTAVRALGYKGEYHVNGNKAYFLRYNIGTRFYRLSNDQVYGHNLSAAAYSLQWLQYSIAYTTPASVKLALEVCDTEITPVGGSFVVSDAFANDASKKRYNALGTAVWNAMLPPPESEDSYWQPGGPLVYPLIPRP